MARITNEAELIGEIYNSVQELIDFVKEQVKRGREGDRSGDADSTERGIFSQLLGLGLQLMTPRIDHLCRDFRPDIIHVHGINMLTEACLDLRVKPLVVSAWGMLNHLLEQPNPADKPSKQELAQRVLQTVDGLIVETPALLVHCREHLRQDQKLALIPMGVDTAHFHPRPHR